MRTSSEVLIACARCCLGLEAPAVLAGRLDPDCDWTATVRLALAHHASPVLARGLATLPADTLPEGLALALALHDADNRSRTDDLLVALARLLEGLAVRGVAAVPFKGPVLGALAYGDPSLRRAGDLDVLVRRADVDTTCRYLRELGFAEATALELGRPMTAAEERAYRRFQCEYQFIDADRGLVVEPHWALARPVLAIDLDYDGFWSRLRPVTVGSLTLPTLSAEDTFLAVGIHAAKHGWARLQWLCDIAALLIRDGELDLDAMLRRARATGVERILLIGIRLAEIVLGIRPPAAVRQRLAADARARACAAEVASRLFTADPNAIEAGEGQWLRLRERWQDRARYRVRRRVTPQLHHLHLLPRPDLTFPLLAAAELSHRHALLPARRALRTLTGPLRRTWHARRPRHRARRILVIAPLPEPRVAAPARVAHALLRLLAGSGYRATLLAWYPPQGVPAPEPPLRPAGIEVIVRSGPDDLRPVLRERLVEFDVVLALDAAGVETLSEAVWRGGTRCPRIVPLPIGRDGERVACRAASTDAVLAAWAGPYGRLRERAPHLPVHLIPYPVQAAPGTKAFDERRGLLFVGHLAEDGGPDTAALIWFLDHVWPLLRRRLNGTDGPLSLDIAGPLGALSLAVRRDPGIRWLGPAGNLSAACASVRLAVAPFPAGPTAPPDLLEVIGRGVPLVATPMVRAELGWEDGTGILTAESGNAPAFAETVVLAYSTPALWQRLRERGLARIHRDHAPEPARRRLAAVLDRIVRSTPHTAPRPDLPGTKHRVFFA